DREPCVRLGAPTVPRDPGHHLERRAGAPHDVHRVRPDVPETDLLIKFARRGCVAPQTVRCSASCVPRRYGSVISPIVTSSGISTATSASPAMSPDAVAIE